MQEDLKYQIMIISKLLKKPENKRCADCKSLYPNWGDIKNGIFLCQKCAEIHKLLGNISIIKSISNDLWSYETLEYFTKLNNIIANSYWEFKLTNANYNKVLEDDNLLKNFIVDKYYKKIWINQDLPDPMTLVINGHDLIEEYAKAGFPPLPEEPESEEDNKYKSVSKETLIRDKIIEQNTQKNNVKLVDFDDDNQKKGFSFIKKKPSNNNNNFINLTNNNNNNNNFINLTNNNNNNFINLINNNNNNNFINFQNNQINKNEKKDSNLVDLFNVETKETRAFNFLNQNLQNAYKSEEKDNKEEQQEKNFQFIMGMQTNDMMNQNNINYNIQNININNNNQRKKSDPFSNLVNF